MALFCHVTVSETEAEYRSLGVPLALAIYANPLVFFWFLLRRGYTNSLRVAASIYLVVFTALSLFR